MSDIVERLRQKERDYYQRDTGGAYGMGPVLRDAADEIERLRGALRTYGRHLDSCGDADAYNHAEVAQCGCGFDAALEGATVQPSAALTPIGIKPACAHEWFRLPSWTLGQSRCYHCGAWNTTPDPTPQPQPDAVASTFADCETAIGMEYTTPPCACAEYYPGLPHHPDCPTRNADPTDGAL